MTSQLDASDAQVQFTLLDELDCDQIWDEFLLLDGLDHLPVQQLGKEKTTAPEAVGTTRQVPQLNKRRSVSWLRRKQKLVALRGEVEALQTRLTFLKMRRAVRGPSHVSIAHVEQREQWKSVAAIAKQECQFAQGENARLKSILRLCTTASKKLQAQVASAEKQRRTISSDSSIFVNAGRVGMTTTRRLHAGNRATFDLLEKGVNARFHDINMIFQKMQQPIERGPSDKVQIYREHDREAGIAVDFKHARVLPFGEGIMSSAIWEVIEFGLPRPCAGVFRRSPNTIHTVSRHTVPLDSNDSLSVDVHAIVKQVAVGTAGSAALTASRSEWSVHHSNGDVSRFTTEEEGWFIVHGHQHPTRSATQQVSELRMTVKLRSKPTDCTLDGISCTLEEVLIPSYRAILNSHLQSVENLLLDSRGAI